MNIFQKIKSSHLLFLILLFIFISCNETEIDDQRPVIDITYTNAFPVNCDTIWFGSTFTFVSRFTDNVALGSYSIEIHHNFDHHSHSTEVADCQLMPTKEANNPFIYIEEFIIPAGTKEHITALEINIPKGDYDEGDYHFTIRLTDREGWSDMRGVGIKMFHKSE